MQQMIDPQQLATSSELGVLKAEYKPSISDLIVACGALLFGLIAFGSIFLILIDEIRPFSTVPLPLALVLIVPVIPLGLAVHKFREHLHVYKLRVYVHKYGFVYVGKAATRAIRWNQIAWIWHQVTIQGGVSTTRISYIHTYNLQCQDGSRLELDNTFSRLRELGKIIELESARYQIPAAQNAFNAGQPVVFGQIQVDRFGITWTIPEQARFIPAFGECSLIDSW